MEGEEFRQYIRTVVDHELLTAEQEARLLRRAQRGEKTARNELVLGNMRLVIDVAMKFRRSVLPLEDVVSEGVLGLYTAIDTFDPSKGRRLGMHALNHIRASVKKAVNEQGYVNRHSTPLDELEEPATEETEEQT